jgi:2'-5' RNA ligase
MAETALIVRVPEAETRVQSLRGRFDPVSRLGVPAHVTVLFPFMAPEHITQDVLERIRAALSGTVSFDFCLRDIGRFPITTYLVPEPSTPFVALTQTLADAFPAFPPFGGQFETIVPHLTVAHGNAEEAQQAQLELACAMAEQGMIRARCASVELLENEAGVWSTMAVFPLARAPNHGA